MSNRYVDIMKHQANSDGPLDYKHRVAEYITDLESRLFESQQSARWLRETVALVKNTYENGGWPSTTMAIVDAVLAATDHIPDAAAC